MKRFYKTVTYDADPERGAFLILLDGKPVKTPGGGALRVPYEILAQEVMREWAAQEKEIVAHTMPLTQILITAQDLVSKERPAMEETVLGYLDTDLLCYRAQEPLAQARRQAELWDPVLRWFREKFGADLQTTTALAALKQPQGAHKVLRDYVDDLDDLRFAVFQMVVSASGSIVLAAAFMEGALNTEDILAAMYVEEDYKAEIYNEALHGRAPQEEKRRAQIGTDLAAARIILAALFA